MRSMAINRRGFTIVELLIVIVVIAILASISVVAYTGIRTRAEDSAVATKVNAIVHTLKAYASVNGGQFPLANWACIGEMSDFPAGNGYDAGWCEKPTTPDPIPLSWAHPVDTTLNTALRTVVNKVPDGNTPEITDDGWTSKGILYNKTSSVSDPVVGYYLKGVRSSCPVGVVDSTYGHYTYCEYRF